MKEKIIEKLSQEIKEFFKEQYDTDVDMVEFEEPSDIKNGHLSTNISLKNAKKVGKSPMIIADEVSGSIRDDEYVERVEFVKPGFINFYFNKKYFADLLNDINGVNYLQFPAKDTRINVEYVSANPTGALHLGHARNAVFGDTLANVLEKVGYPIYREYYVNDAGVQMNNLGASVRAFYLEFTGEELKFPGDGYKGKEIREIAGEIYEKYGDSKKSENLDFFTEYGYQYNLAEIKNIMKRLGVEFDHYASERSYHDSGAVAAAIATLAEKGEVYEEDGAKWLKTTKYGDDKNRVLEKSDGTHTYLTSDIAYHSDKLNRGSDLLIDIWGGDHHGYIERVTASLEGLGYKREDFEVILIQMVSIFNNNEKVKMSKRAGTSVTIEDLLELIDPEVLRYFFIMRSPDTQLDFDISVAQKENSDNPVFYVQYAHARINNLVNKYNEEIGEDLVVTKNKLTEEDIKLISTLDRYKNEIVEAAVTRRPHIIANYLYNLANVFHKYYNQERIFTDDEEITMNKIYIVKNVQKILADGLNILGIKAKDNM